MYFSSLKEQVILVIGAKQGIGKAIVESFLNEGAIVVAGDISYEEQQLQLCASNYFQIKIDVTNENHWQHLLAELQKKQLLPDVFIAVAGISTMGYLIESNSADFDQVYQVNAKGVYLGCKYLVGWMTKQQKQGRVILISSQAGKNGYRGMSAYVASKHAVLGITKTLALETAADGILVNAVCPGIIETSMKERERVDGGKIRGMTAAEVLAEDISQIPLQRTGIPQDVANVVLFLASPLASYMTGQAINVTGGMTMS